MKKRILSLTLVIVMLLSLIPFGIVTVTAEGAELITKIEINDFNPQLYGGMTASQAKVECSYTLPDNAGYCKGNNNTYIINDGNIIYNNEKLIADKETVIYIEIYAMPFGVDKENPTHDFDGENLDNIEVWINGVLRTDVTVSGYNPAWRCVDVYVPVTVEEYTGETHTVTYNSNGGSDVAPEVVNDQFYAAEPEKPTKDGFVFDGWYADAELTQKFNFKNTKITDDITLYAAWEEKIVAENITKIEINDFNPQLYNGMTASQAKLECSYTLPDNAGYCKGNNNTYIKNGENTIYNDEKLSADKETVIYIGIYAMPVGTYVENPAYDFDSENLDDIEVWINGVLRTDVTVSGYNSAWRCVYVYIPVEVSPLVEINEIEISGVEAPIPGKSLEVAPNGDVPAGANYTITSRDWMKNHGQGFATGETFQSGQEYWARFLIEAADGYTFPSEASNITLTVNDSCYLVGEVSVWDEDEVYVYFKDIIAESVYTVDDVTIAGTKGSPIVSTDITIKKEGNPFSSNVSGVKIDNLPAGLSQSTQRVDDTTVKITVTGTPTEVSTSTILFTITVKNNENAKFNITAPAVVPLTGSVEISGTAKYDETLTAVVTDTNNTGTLKYIWKRDGVAISGANEATYKLTQSDVGKVVSVVVNSTNETGDLTCAGKLVEKADAPAAPSGLVGVAPTVGGGNDGKITGVDNTMIWSQNKEFVTFFYCSGTEITDLKAGTYYVRVFETSTHKASDYVTVVVPDGAAPIVEIDSIDISGLVAPQAGQTVGEYFDTIPIPTLTPDLSIVESGFILIPDFETRLADEYVFQEGETYILVIIYDVDRDGVVLDPDCTVTIDKGDLFDTEVLTDSTLGVAISFELAASTPDPDPDPTYTVGDINGNGKIDARDYLLLKRAYFGTYTLTCAPEAADINGNGKIDARDYLLLKRAYFGTYTLNCAPEAADINGNGKIDARDYLLLKRAYFGTYEIK